MILRLRTETQYDFTFIYDGNTTIGEVLTAMIADKILHWRFEKALPKADNIGYNTDKVPSEQMPGLREEAS